MLLLITQGAFAQIKIIKLEKSAIPPSIKYSGRLVNAVRYTDGAGQHIVITTETGITDSRDTANTDSRDAALYAWHYDIAGDTYKLTWRTYDFVKECPVDLAANYLPDTFAITDLNNDGKAEVWLMYQTVCHGDVSPAEMKIIMHEGEKKYAVRGTNRVKVSDKAYYGGKFTFDEAFNNGPELFREYARQLWKKNLYKNNPR